MTTWRHYTSSLGLGPFTALAVAVVPDLSMLLNLVTGLRLFARLHHHIKPPVGNSYWHFIFLVHWLQDEATHPKGFYA